MNCKVCSRRLQVVSMSMPLCSSCQLVASHVIPQMNAAMYRVYRQHLVDAGTGAQQYRTHMEDAPGWVLSYATSWPNCVHPDDTIEYSTWCAKVCESIICDRMVIDWKEEGE